MRKHLQAYRRNRADSDKSSSGKSHTSLLNCFSHKHKKPVLVEDCTTPPKYKNRHSFPEYDPSKKVLVLDLDETLVKVTIDPPKGNHYVFDLKDEIEEMQLYAIPRPGLHEFIEEMGKIYNLCIYTSGDKLYAGAVLKAVGILKKMCAVYPRKFTYAVSEQVHIKKLSILGYPPEKMVFIDDFPLQMKHQPDNGILLKEFRGDAEDKELINLIPFLKYIDRFEDVRPVTRHLFDFYSKPDTQPSDVLLRNCDEASEPRVVASERSVAEHANTLTSLDDPMMRMKLNTFGRTPEHCQDNCSIRLRVANLDLHRHSSEPMATESTDPLLKTCPTQIKKVLSAPDNSGSITKLLKTISRPQH